MIFVRTNRSINLESEIETALIKNINARNIPHFLKERSGIVLMNCQGYYNNEIAQTIGVHENTVSKWVNRFRCKLPHLQLLAEGNNKDENNDIENILNSILTDDFRSGKPFKYDLAVRFFIIWICCQSPQDYGFPSDMWHLPQIHLAVISSEIVNQISIGGIYNILVSYSLFPWKNRYYLHSKDKYENTEVFTKKIENINLVYQIAQEQRQAISTDGNDLDDLFPLAPIEGENLQDTLNKEDEKLSQVDSNAQVLNNAYTTKNNEDNSTIENKTLINSAYLKRCAEKFRKAFGDSQKADEAEIENFFTSLANDGVDDTFSTSNNDTVLTSSSKENKENIDPYEKYHEYERNKNVENVSSKQQSLLPFMQPVEVHVGTESVPPAENQTSCQQSLLPFAAPVEVYESEGAECKIDPKTMVEKLENKVEEIKKGLRRNQVMFNKIQELSKKLRILDAQFAMCEDKDKKAKSYYKTAVNLFRQVFPNADIDVLISVYSFDEMTGVQALEDAFQKKNPLPGVAGYKEFNYIRHGVLSLIAFLDIISGKVRLPFINTTRDENDVAEAFYHIMANDPGKVKYIFICDNLNVHKSEALVRMVAEFCGISDDLGIKGRSGILKNCESREAFLSDSSHRIFFLYTPVHCSWMNQIEIFFSVMSRQFLKQNSFKSLKDLKERIVKYINMYNRLFSHGFNWRYNDVPKPKSRNSLFLSAINTIESKKKAA